MKEPSRNTARSLDSMKRTLKELQTLPAVGPSIARDLYDLGYRSVEEVGGGDPEVMFEDHCHQKGIRVDRCVLYTFRCAVYAARTKDPDPKLLLWWNWKDRMLPRRSVSEGYRHI